MQPVRFPHRKGCLISSPGRDDPSSEEATGCLGHGTGHVGWSGRALWCRNPMGVGKTSSSGMQGIFLKCVGLSSSSPFLGWGVLFSDFQVSPQRGFLGSLHSGGDALFPGQSLGSSVPLGSRPACLPATKQKCLPGVFCPATGVPERAAERPVGKAPALLLLPGDWLCLGGEWRLANL